jgi:hypothetical protein
MPSFLAQEVSGPGRLAGPGGMPAPKPLARGGSCYAVGARIKVTWGNKCRFDAAIVSWCTGLGYASRNRLAAGADEEGRVR